jgi:tRNA pseudouridine38-40 synthase
MVRSIVGTLLEVGKGNILPEHIEDLYKQKKRTLSSPTAPACGLCLIKVIY